MASQRHLTQLTAAFETLALVLRQQITYDYTLLISFAHEIRKHWGSQRFGAKVLFFS